MVLGSEFRKRERRRLIEWFASKDIEKIEDASSAGRFGPLKHCSKKKRRKSSSPCRFFTPAACPNPAAPVGSEVLSVQPGSIPYGSRVQEALRLGEGESIEFKRSISFDSAGSVEQILQTVAAFANSGDGTIFIGIEDEGQIKGIPAAGPKERDQIS